MSAVLGRQPHADAVLLLGRYTYLLDAFGGVGGLCDVAEGAHALTKILGALAQLFALGEAS